MTEEMNRLRQESWAKALYCFATAKIFDWRARSLRLRLRLLTFLGIALPVIVGGIVMSFGTSTTPLKYLIPAASLLALSQIILSVWSLVADWQGGLAYALGSAAENNEISRLYEQIARNPPSTPDQLEDEVRRLDERDKRREERDTHRGTTPKERRAGHRKALFHFGRACGSCQETPKSLTPSDCDGCGNFPRRYLW